MARHGFYIKQNYDKAVSSYLIELLNSGKIQRSYSSKKMGWIETSKNSYDYLLESLSNEDGNFFYDNRNKINFKKGNLNDYIDFLKKDVFSFEGTKLAFAIGLSAILNGYYEKFINVNTPVFNFASESGFGKSTVLELMASIYGSPKLDNYGFNRSLAGTAKALIAGFKGRYGVALILDDESASTLSSKERQLIIYNLAQNEPWQGCSSSGNLRDRTDGWVGTAILSSEVPIIQKEEFVKQGVTNRIITLNDVSWTIDAEHSNRIKNFIYNNYGHYAYEFASTIKNYGSKKLIKMRNNAIKTLSSKIKYKKKERIAEVLSSVYVSLEILNEQYPNTFNVEDIIDFLLIHYDLDERNVAETFLEKFKQYISRDYKNFVKETFDTGYRNIDFDGNKVNGIFRVHYSENKSTTKPARLFISRLYFDSVCKAEKVEEGKYILKQWRHLGIIDTEHEKLTRRCSALGNIQCVVLNLDHADVGLIWPGKELDPITQTSPTIDNSLYWVKQREECRKEQQKKKVLNNEEVVKTTPISTITFEDPSIDEIFNEFNNL